MTIRASQVVVEALVRAAGTPIRASQCAVEILVWNHTVTTPAVYPTLTGLGFSVVKRPKMFVGSAESGSGWQVRVGYSYAPLWEWDLTYDLLSDPGAGSDLKTLLGFFLAMQGNLTPFLFLDPDDNTVTGQVIGETDGTTTSWALYRSYGGSDGSGTELIGMTGVPGATFNVYLNGTLQSPSSYSVLTTTPVYQQIRFNSAPASGQQITVDMSYYYYVHFKDSTTEFEKFMQNLWSLKKVTLESLRG